MLGWRRCHANSWGHSLLPVNINAAKSFSLAAHIWRAWRLIFVCVDSDSIFLTLEITGVSAIFFFYDAVTPRQWVNVSVGKGAVVPVLSPISWHAVWLSISLSLIFLSWRFSNGVHWNPLWAGGVEMDSMTVTMMSVMMRCLRHLYKMWGNRESLNTAIFQHDFLWPPNSTRTFADCPCEIVIFT